MRKERELTLEQNLFLHYRLVGTGRFFISADDPDEISEEELVREEHWGWREKCAKCRKYKYPMADFKNGLALSGIILLGFATAVVLSVAIGVTILLNS